MPPRREKVATRCVDRVKLGCALPPLQRPVLMTQVVGDALDLRSEIRSGACHRFVDRSVGRVTAQNLLYPRLEGHRLALRAGGEIGGSQDVGCGTDLAGEFGQRFREAALGGLVPATAVMCHEGSEPRRESATPQMPRTVNRVHAGVDKARRISKIVKPGRRNDQDALGDLNVLGEFLRASANSLHMPPAVGEFRDVQMVSSETSGHRDEVVHTIRLLNPRATVYRAEGIFC